MANADRGTRIKTFRKEPAVGFAVGLLGQDIKVLFDVGAHNGDVARDFLDVLPKAAKVVLFEADPRRSTELQRLRSADPRVADVVQAAVGRSSHGRASFVLAEGEASHLALGEEGATPGAIQVETLSLDDYVRSHGMVPDLIKLDVEGAEAEAMEGASDLIEGHRPTIIFEDCSLQAARLVTEVFGYCVINCHSLESFDKARDAPGKTYNFLAYHPASGAARILSGLTRHKLIEGSLGDFEGFTSRFISRKDGEFRSRRFPVSPGNFVVQMGFPVLSGDGDMKIEYWLDDHLIGYYGGPRGAIVSSYSSCPLHVDASARMQVRILSNRKIDRQAASLSIFAIR